MYMYVMSTFLKRVINVSHLALFPNCIVFKLNSCEFDNEKKMLFKLKKFLLLCVF